MSKLMRISEFAKILGISKSTLKRMEQEGKIAPAYTGKRNYRYYSEDQIAEFTKTVEKSERIVIGYCRVSTKAQADDLETQVQNVKSYMIAKGYQFKIITDIASGINYHRNGLDSLIAEICKRNVSKVVVLYKDRLARFGFELIQNICHLHGCEIEVIDNTERTKEQELCDDLIQIVTVFANRIYGQRNKKTKELIEGVRKNVLGNEDTADSDS